jgi:hypothetical protein
VLITQIATNLWGCLAHRRRPPICFCWLAGLTLGWGFSGLTSHLKINPGKIWIILDNPDLHFSAF